jgi:hypothetical protein
MPTLIANFPDCELKINKPLTDGRLHFLNMGTCCGGGTVDGFLSGSICGQSNNFLLANYHLGVVRAQEIGLIRTFSRDGSVSSAAQNEFILVGTRKVA